MFVKNEKIQQQNRSEFKSLKLFKIHIVCSAVLLSLVFVGQIALAVEILEVPSCSPGVDTIVVNLSTGQDGEGNPDPYWDVSSLNGGGAAYGTAKHSDWVDGPWIQPDDSGTPTDVAAGEYTYSLLFQINSIHQYTNIELEGVHSADNQLENAWLNTFDGIGLALPNCTGLKCFESTMSFNVSGISEFRNGTHQLHYNVVNKAASWGDDTPSGLMVKAELTLTCAQPQTTVPDLIVSNISFDEDCNMTVTVANIGDPTGDHFTFLAEPILVPVWGPGPQTGTSGTFQGLGNTPSSQTWSNVRVDGSQITVVVDGSGSVDESEESNNTLTVQVPLHCQGPEDQLPDLIVSSAEFDENCNLTVTIANLGAPTSQSFDFTGEPLLNAFWGPGTHIGHSSTIPGMDQSPFTETWSGIEVEGGFITITVDPQNQILESKGSNNTVTIAVPEHCQGESDGVVNGPDSHRDVQNEVQQTINDVIDIEICRRVNTTLDLLGRAINAGEDEVYGLGANLADDAFYELRDIRGILSNLNEEVNFESLGVGELYINAREALSRFISSTNSFKRDLEEAHEEFLRNCPSGTECNKDEFKQNAENIFKRAKIQIEIQIRIFESFKDILLEMVGALSSN